MLSGDVCTAVRARRLRAERPWEPCGENRSSSSREMPSPGPVGRRADNSGHEQGAQLSPDLPGYVSWVHPIKELREGPGRPGCVCKRGTRTRCPTCLGSTGHPSQQTWAQMGAVPRAEKLGAWELLDESIAQVCYRKRKPRCGQSLHFHQLKLGT